MSYTKPLGAFAGLPTAGSKKANPESQPALAPEPSPEAGGFFSMGSGAGKDVSLKCGSRGHIYTVTPRTAEDFAIEECPLHETR